MAKSKKTEKIALLEGMKQRRRTPPNALAKLQLSVASKAIDSIEETQVGKKQGKEPNGASKKEASRSKRDDKLSAIWKAMSMGAIDINYACVGYTYGLGRPILDQGLFVELLINYGFKIQDINDFIDDFVESAEDADGMAPIVMVNAHAAKIYSDIGPLDINRRD